MLPQSKHVIVFQPLDEIRFFEFLELKKELQFLQILMRCDLLNL